MALSAQRSQEWQGSVFVGACIFSRGKSSQQNPLVALASCTPTAASHSTHSPFFGSILFGVVPPTCVFLHSSVSAHTSLPAAFV
jgi:hypothetical protein